MNVYLTGVNITKNPSKNTTNRENKPLNKKLSQDKTEKIKDETKLVNEVDISSDQVKVSFITSKDITSKTNQLVSSKELNNLDTNRLNNNSNSNNKINNNFISNEDKNKKNNKKKRIK